MNRDSKQAFIDAYKQRLGDAEVLLLSDFTGMNVETMNRLRRQLEAFPDLELKVVKNTLCKKAIAGSELEILAPHLTGPTVMLAAFKDPVSPVKSILDFQRDNAKVFKIKATYSGGKLLNDEQVRDLSRLPSREQLVGQFMGTLQAPMARFVSTLAAVPQEFVGVLAAYQKKVEEGA